jgi:phage-related protein
MKAVEFCGNTLKSIKSFPAPVRYEIGHQLERVQNGLNPIDWKSMPAVGRGVREIRVHDTAQYRVLYFAKHKGIIYVLHAFQKKTRKTRRHDIERSRIALKKIISRNSK